MRSGTQDVLLLHAAMCRCSLLQVNLVGKAQTSYLPGVLVPEVNVGGAADQAGFKAGDLILRVGDYEVAASSKQVGRPAGIGPFWNSGRAE